MQDFYNYEIVLGNTRVWILDSFMVIWCFGIIRTNSCLQHLRKLWLIHSMLFYNTTMWSCYVLGFSPQRIYSTYTRIYTALSGSRRTLLTTVPAFSASGSKFLPFWCKVFKHCVMLITYNWVLASLIKSSWPKSYMDALQQFFSLI